MASGENMLQSAIAVQSLTNPAIFDTRVGGSTPEEAFPVYDFDPDTVEYMDFSCRLSNDYAGGGLTLTGPWFASTAVSGNVRWGAAIRRIDNDGVNVGTAHTYDYNDVTDAAPGTLGQKTEFTIPFTNGADMDNLAAGETFILRIRRNATDGADTMTGDAELWADNIGIRET